MNYIRIAQRILNTPLAIDEGKLEIIMAAIGPRLDVDFTPQIEGAAPNNINTRVGGEYRVTKQGVAIIEVNGSLVNRYASAPSGVTSYDEIRTMFRAAAANDDVKGILMRIDSYGGEVSGMWDTLDEIRAVGKKKPVWASVDDAAFSAAYGLASQASRIYTTRTGGVGSVGVIAAHSDRSVALQQQGVKVTLVYAGKRKADFAPFHPLNEEAHAELTRMVMSNHATFNQYVAEGRSMRVEQVLATESGRYAGEAGVAVGFADHVGTFDDALAALTTHVSGAYGQSASMNAAEAANQHEGETMEQQSTVNTAAIQAEATIAERSRIAAILESPEAKTRMKSAFALALHGSMPASEVVALLGTLPEQGTGFVAAMGAVANPEIRPDAHGEPDSNEVNAAVESILKAGLPKGGK